MPELIEIARTAVNAASEKQASDILVMDLRGVASFADYFVLCSAESTPQVAAIADELEREFHELGVRLHHREGADHSGWVLMDFGDVIVHIFSPEQRAFYDLESAWARAPHVVRVP